MRRAVLAVFAMAVSTSGQAADAQPLKIYISADMEGVGGVVTPFQTDRTKND